MLRKVLCLIIGTGLFNLYALKIEIKKGVVEPDPIAIVDFYEEDGADSDDGKEIAEIVKNDLKLSGMFAPIDKKAFIENKETLCKFGANPKNWQVLNARFLVHGRISGSTSIKFELIDVLAGKQMLSVEVSGKASNLREIAHIIADHIYERITNEEGYFNTKIAYVETSYDKVSENRKTRIVMVDQDGHNPLAMTDGKQLDLMPKFSNKGDMLAIISCNENIKGPLGRSAHVYLINTKNKSKKLMISQSMMKDLIKKNKNQPIQMIYAPDFSPDGSEAVLAIIFDGKSAIYKLNFETNVLTQLTQHECIDTSPCFSDDGKKIVFTSNRHGREAIYTMNADGTEQKRISKGEGKYSQPKWSPRGDLIAFAKQTGGQFYIGVMKPDGSGERLISSGYLVECPDWASNGRYIVYSTQPDKNSKSKIAAVDITGNHSRIIQTKKDASYPTWSPSVSKNR